MAFLTALAWLFLTARAEPQELDLLQKRSDFEVMWGSLFSRFRLLVRRRCLRIKSFASLKFLELMLFLQLAAVEGVAETVQTSQNLRMLQLAARQQLCHVCRW